MVQVKLTYNKKPKRTQEVEVNSREHILEIIEGVFNVDRSTVKFIKPPLHDEASFEKSVTKEGMQILFLGSIKKKKTEQEIKREKMKQKKEEQLMESEEVKKKLEELKKNDHERIIEQLKKEKIIERGFEHMNQFNEVEDLGTDHLTCPVFFFRCMEEFKQFAKRYEVQPKNPDGLIIEDLRDTIRQIDGERGKVIDPLDWVAGFIIYCSDDIEYPFPTYDFHYTFTKILTTMSSALRIDNERKEPNAIPNNYNQITEMIGIEIKAKKIKKTPIDYDDDEVDQEQIKNEFKFVLQCDLTDENVTTLEEGIIKRFEEKVVWENFYAFDLKYLETIIDFVKLPQYLLIHPNRIGYPENKDEGEEIELFTNKKNKKRIRTKCIIDANSLFQGCLNDKLEAGRYERDNFFSRFDNDERYKSYLQEIKKKGVNIEDYSNNQLKYMYFDYRLFDLDIFHEYYFEALKGSKPTGEYRLVGIILHKGDYFHIPNAKHAKTSEAGHSIKQCRGELKVMIYNRGSQWRCFHKAKVTRCTLEDALSEQYWGDGEWTPAMFLYRAIYIRQVELEPPEEDD